ncbi:MAG: ChaN family lipoprotein [Proteobacteria bacterium]|nr:ChaN family lipoprotein [Pseudomonadota bacterium]
MPLLLLALALVVGFSVSAGSGPPDGGSWASPLLREHPLAGRVWLPAERRFAEPAEVVGRLAAAALVLLGEKHDNPDHHRIQAWLVGALVARGRRPAVAFEMFGDDQAGRLAEHLVARPADAAGIGEAVGWKEAGWPDWEMYRPIAETALRAGLPMVAANLSRTAVRAIRREGLAALGVEQLARFGLGSDPPAAIAEGHRAEIVEAHCGMLPEAAIPSMVAVQVARDAHMAEALLAGAHRPGVDGAVMIAGVGHIRADRGVPWHLRRLAPDLRIATVAPIEVVAGETEPAAYLDRVAGAPLPFDAVWFTPRVDAEEPCEKFRHQLERMRAPSRGESTK